MSDFEQPNVIKTTCPICGKPAEKKYYPFCSKRCSDIDLYHWLNGSYAVPENETDNNDMKLPDEENE